MFICVLLIPTHPGSDVLLPDNFGAKPDGFYNEVFDPVVVVPKFEPFGRYSLSDGGVNEFVVRIGQRKEEL